MRRRFTMLASGAVLATGALLGFAGGATAQDYILIGNLVDFTGNTAVIGKEYGQAKIDATNYINENGGIDGKLLDVDTVDYSYIPPRAIAAYKKWEKQDVVAIQGWGTGDTEALGYMVAKDETPYFSASYSGHLTDPTGAGSETQKAAPYTFPMGPTYSDGIRALLSWAAEDWKAKGGEGQPKYVHMGDDHDYPNATKQTGEDYAKELGFEVLPAIHYALTPGDFSAQCLSLKESGANYAFLANTAGSNIFLLKSCDIEGMDVQFMSNIWGYDENVMKAAGESADGVVWVMGAGYWGDDVPGMKLVHEISKMSDPTGNRYRTLHYIRGVCSVFFMKDAMEVADKMEGGITGPNIKAAMEKMEGHVPAGLEGVCPKGTWTAEDHRGFADIPIYQGHVKGSTDGDFSRLVADGAISMEPVFRAEIQRRPEWLGQ